MCSLYLKTVIMVSVNSDDSNEYSIDKLYLLNLLITLTFFLLFLNRAPKCNKLGFIIKEIIMAEPVNIKNGITVESKGIMKTNDKKNKTP
ncbi:hypothetical protein BFS14_23975 [Serratia fonticola]|nr:hypothetical protein BFS14_23975 [Serratia fonticola]